MRPHVGDGHSRNVRLTVAGVTGKHDRSTRAAARSGLRWAAPDRRRAGVLGSACSSAVGCVGFPSQHDWWACVQRSGTGWRGLRLAAGRRCKLPGLGADRIAV